ncbi:biogenesis of lysosome- organelles complex 1 subunit 1 [Blomia tropicalis]|nr:biogenesis of lysosome- organelles complex 1 subunit 1 [Blomia tropicalis]
MLSSMLKEHQLKQIKKREEIEQKRNAAIGSSVNFATAAVTHLNDGVAQTYLNQRKLDSEAKQLVANIDQFSRSINQWVTLMNNFNDSLKQLGDVENWAKCIENDMNEVSSILEYVYKSYNQTGTENET